MSNQPITRRFLKLCSGDAWIASAKIVLFLLVVLIAITPLTQMIWTNDNLLHGSDTETTLAMVFTFVLLLLLRAHDTRDTFAWLLDRIHSCLAACFGVRVISPGARVSSQPMANGQSGYPKTHRGLQVHPGFQIPLQI